MNQLRGRTSAGQLYLKSDEERLLNGEHGHALEIAMSVLVKLGDMYGADKMIKIENTHVDASTYGGIHEAGLQFCKRLSKENARFRVPTTLCISAIDFAQWKELRIPKAFAEKQIELADAYSRMGAMPTWTCAPYQYGSGVRFGQNVAWGESNAIAFVNSVVGARTNRYGDLVDVCAGLVGKVPEFGLYLDENRRGQVIVSADITKGKHLTWTDYAALGYHVGATVGQKIPVIEGIDPSISLDQLKYFAAAAASSGSVALFHIVGVTPEAPTTHEALCGDVAEDKIQIGNEELNHTCEQLSTVRGVETDFVVLGCPHYSVEQIGETAAALEGRRIRKNVEVWLFTSRVAKRIAENMGYVQMLKRSGVKVLADTCPLHIPLRRWSFHIMATDSAKMAHYAPSILDMQVVFADAKGCLEYATAKKETVEVHSWKK